MARVAAECVSLLQEYSDVDMNRASQAELQRQLDEARLNEDLCSQALRAAYRGEGGAAMASHLARALSVHALQAQLTLSARFQEMAGYCDILAQLVNLLSDDLTELQQALTATPPLPQADAQALGALFELDRQSFEVSVVDYASTCQ
jgi:hypothetical protein